MEIPAPVIKDEYKSKYKKVKNLYINLKKEHKKTVESIKIIKQAIEDMVTEQNVAGFLMFAVAVKTGGKFELTPYDIEVAKKLEPDHTLDIADKDGSLLYLVKRKEINV